MNSVPRCFRLNRPALLRLFCAAMSAGVLAAQVPVPDNESGQTLRRYRVDAVIRVLSIPIVKKAGVGSGFAFLEQSGLATDRQLELLFAAGSWPEQAHGLNRMGYIEELISERPGGVSGARYFGFITSSDEQSVGDAQEALRNAEGTGPFTVIQGEAEPGAFRAAKLRFHADRSYTWSDWEELLPQARRVAAESFGGGQAKEGVWGDSKGRPLPMLYTVLTAIRSREKEQELRYVWEQHQYTMTVRKRGDRSVGGKLVADGLADDPDSIIRLDARVVNTNNGKRYLFRLWYDSDSNSPLPLRVEYRPRHFLQLNFEVDPEAESGDELASRRSLKMKGLNSTLGGTE